MGLYRILGTAFILIGLALLSFSYFTLAAVSITGAGLSTIILGFTCICLSFTAPRVSEEASQILLQSGVSNVTNVLESLKIKNKAIYFPQNIFKENPQALIPLSSDSEIQKVYPEIFNDSMIRLIPNSSIAALAFTTPGNLSLRLLPDKPEGTQEEIKAALRYLLTRELLIARRVKVKLRDSQIQVEVSGLDFKLEDKLYCQYLGSTPASIAAAVSSEALEKPIRIAEEINRKSKVKILLEVVS